MILETTTIVYNPNTKLIIGEFEAGIDLYPAIGCETFEGTAEEFLLKNTEYSLINEGE